MNIEQDVVTASVTSVEKKTTRNTSELVTSAVGNLSNASGATPKVNTELMMRRRVKNLLKRPQPEQRTEEWFKARQTRVTASEAASCFKKTKDVCEPYVNDFKLQNFKYNDNEGLNPYEKKDDYITKKCESFYGRGVFRDNMFTLWGKKYEDVASRLYKKIKKKVVYDFGLISHSRLKWLAASPDGITEDGVMLEIKCPKSRKIDPGAPPLYYYIQCQIQLEVCNLEDCDFLECEIEEVTESEFLKIEPCYNQDKGILFQIVDSGPEPKFIYPPVELTTTTEFLAWRDKQLMERNDITPCYYFVKKFHIIAIKRNKEWFEKNKGEIKATWDIITRMQQNEEEFIKYKESINQIKNKSFNEKYEATNCLISEPENSIHTPFFIMPTEMEEVDTCCEIKSEDVCMDSNEKCDDNVCMIED